MEKTNLAKRQLGLEWRNGDTLIAYCKDQNALRKILSEGLFGAISLYSSETNKEAVKIMIADVIEDYKYNDVSVIVETITDIRKGKRKIYGKVTPFDLREMITEKLNSVAIQKEDEHYDVKGYGDQDITNDRQSGRLSDYLKPFEETKQYKNLKK